MLCIPPAFQKNLIAKLVLRLFSFWDFFEKSLMAISVTNAAVPLLNINRSTSSSSSSSSSSSKLCVSNSLRFPQQLRSFQMGNNRSLSSLPQRRNLLRIEAKKQTFSSFDDLLATAEKPVLVDFYATWCGPCQFMVSVLNEVSISLNDKIQLVKIDTEKYPQIADQYSIQALPTFIIFRDGKPCDRFEGALTAQQLIQRIETALA